MSDAPVCFSVFGLPRAQGSLRHVGRGRLIHPPDLVRWRLDIAAAAAKEMDARLPLEGPVVLDAHFYLPRPKSVKNRALPWRKPDLDKLVRGLCDALTGTVVGDDAQVVKIVATKQYADETPPGVTVIVGVV